MGNLPDSMEITFDVLQNCARFYNSKSHYLVNVIQSDKIVWFVLCIKPLLPA